MPVRIDPPDVARARSQAIAAAHAAWVAGEIAAGVDGVTPEDRPATSDYNQHVPDLEASGVALDMFALAVDEALAAVTLT
jgi:hypothetical protein